MHYAKKQSLSKRLSDWWFRVTYSPRHQLSRYNSYSIYDAGVARVATA